MSRGEAGEGEDLDEDRLQSLVGYPHTLNKLNSSDFVTEGTIFEATGGQKQRQTTVKVIPTGGNTYQSKQN
jgi:hypothetical protein